MVLSTIIKRLLRILAIWYAILQMKMQKRTLRICITPIVILVKMGTIGSHVAIEK